MSGNGPGTRVMQPGPFLIQIDGVSVPAQCSATEADAESKLPDKFTWKDLKDEIRKDATHGVWTSVEIRAHGQHTVPRHFVRAKRQDEAVAAYSKYASLPSETFLLILNDSAFCYSGNCRDKATS